MKKFLLTILFCCFFCGCARSGGVSQAEYDAVVKQRNELQNDYNKLNENLTKIQSEKESLQSEYSEYKESMKEYELLSDSELEARKIEAERIIAEEKAAKEKAEAEEAAKREAEEKLGYETGITYDQLARTPDDYINKKVKFKGEVLQTLENSTKVQIRLAINGNYNKIVFCEYDKDIVSSRILEGDNIIIYGVSYGLFTYTSSMNIDITIPAIIVDKIENNEKNIGVEVINPDIKVETQKTPDKEENLNVEIVAEYLLKTKWSTYHYIVVKNNSNLSVDVSTSSIAYDSKENLVSATDSNQYAIGPDCTSIIVEYFDTEENVARVETEISALESDYYDSVLQDLSYEKTDIKNGVILRVKNNGSDSAEFVEVYVLFFLNDKLVYESSNYFGDDDFEIKPGKIITKQIDSYEDFDRVEIYLTGRKTNW